MANSSTSPNCTFLDFVSLHAIFLGSLNFDSNKWLVKINDERPQECSQLNHSQYKESDPKKKFKRVIPEYKCQYLNVGGKQIENLEI